MKTDIEIAQSVELQPIVDVVKKVSINYDDLELYGKYKAKLSFDKIREVEKNPVGKLILVTAINAPSSSGVRLLPTSRRRSKLLPLALSTGDISSSWRFSWH